MAEASVPKINLISKDSDFCAAFKLQPEKVIDNGMYGEIVLTKCKHKHYVVKKFTLLDKDKNNLHVRTFFSEVKFMQSFNHPFVVKCILAGQCPEYLAICMKYFERGTLHDYVGDLSLELLERCVTQVACALRYVHNNNIAHLDVKLDNIFLEWDMNAILGDFGLAMEMAPGQKTLISRKCGGTHGYLAPERIIVPVYKEIDPYKLDSYCLGVVLWALATDRYPNEYVNYFMDTRSRQDLPPHIRSWLLQLLNSCPSGRPTVTDILTTMRQEGAYQCLIDNN